MQILPKHTLHFLQILEAVQVGNLNPVVGLIAKCCSYQTCVLIGFILLKQHVCQDLGQDVPACGTTTCLDADSVCEVVIYGKVVNCAWGFNLLPDIPAHNLWRTYLKQSNSNQRDIVLFYLRKVVI